MELLHTLSDIAIRYLPEEKFMALRANYLSLRRKLNPLLRLIYGSYNADELKAHLQETIGTDFEILMVHSSVNHMQPMYTGTPLELLKMLIDFCGPDKTLVMPAFFFGDPKVGSIQETFQAEPRFNLGRTPSQMGLMTELFRRTKGAVQSRDPVYRVVALGPLAKELVMGHEHATSSAGFGSPFEYMTKHNTMIIGIGKSFQVMTQVHHVDEIMGETFPVPKVPIEERKILNVTVIDGEKEIPVKLRDIGLKWRFNIAKLPEILDKNILKYWSFHNTPLFSAQAKQVTDSLVEAAKQGKTLYEPR